jgi:hypothetical protein
MVSISSTHTKTQVFLWLLAKRTLSRISREEFLLLTILTADRDDLQKLSNDLSIVQQKMQVLSRTRSRRFSSWKATRDLLKRILFGFEPKVSCEKWWDGSRPKQANRIGVGYKDKGTLSTAPSWKDQMILTEGDTPDASLRELEFLQIQLSFLDFLLSRTRPADETQKGRKGERR